MDHIRTTIAMTSIQNFIKDRTVLTTRKKASINNTMKQP